MCSVVEKESISSACSLLWERDVFPLGGNHRRRETNGSHFRRARILPWCAQGIPSTLCTVLQDGREGCIRRWR